MARKRKAYSPSFKASVALAAVKGDRTVSALAGHFDVHPTLVQLRKKQLRSGAEAVFTPDHRAADAGAGAKQAELDEQLGRAQMELAWLRKSLPLRLTRGVRRTTWR